MDLTPVDSRHVAAVGYDPSTGDLEVQFHTGSTYRYSNVPPELYKEMMGAPSIGQFHALQVRSRFPFQKLEPEE